MKKGMKVAITSVVVLTGALAIGANAGSVLKSAAVGAGVGALTGTGAGTGAVAGAIVGGVRKATR